MEKKQEREKSKIIKLKKKVSHIKKKGNREIQALFPVTHKI